MAAETTRKDKWQGHGAQPLGALIAKTLDPILAKRGFAMAELLTRWPAIAGAETARFSRPEKIHWPRTQSDTAEPGILVLRVEGHAALDVQHTAPQILERINVYFGWRAVAGLRLRQGPVAVPQKPGRPPRRPLEPAEADQIRESVAQIEDEGLRGALERLGRASRAARPQR